MLFPNPSDPPEKTPLSTRTGEALTLAIASTRFMDRQRFIREWSGPGTAYAIVRKMDFDKWFASNPPHEILGRSKRAVLVKNRPPVPAR